MIKNGYYRLNISNSSYTRNKNFKNDIDKAYKFYQVKAIKDSVGDKLEVILDGGVRRGTHVLKALAAGATACSFGKMFLFSLGAGGQQGVERALLNMHDEIRRNMVLMGCKSISELDETKIIYRR